MTPHEFLATIQGYFGREYNQIQLDLLRGWVKARPMDYLTVMFKEVVKGFAQTQATPLPLIQNFEALDPIVSAMVSESRAKIQRQNEWRLLESIHDNRAVPFEELKTAISQGKQAVEAFKKKYFGNM